MQYGLDLTLAWWIHPVFHVLNLKRFHQSEEFERGSDYLLPLWLMVRRCNDPHLAHVPMSPWARTSVLEWLAVIKSTTKSMDLGTFSADWVFVSGELHVGVVHCCSCSPTHAV